MTTNYQRGEEKPNMDNERGPLEKRLGRCRTEEELRLFGHQYCREKSLRSQMTLKQGWLGRFGLVWFLCLMAYQPSWVI